MYVKYDGLYMSKNLASILDIYSIFRKWLPFYFQKMTTIFWGK